MAYADQTDGEDEAANAACRHHERTLGRVLLRSNAPSPTYAEPCRVARAELTTIVSIVGPRPRFLKAVAIRDELRERHMSDSRAFAAGRRDAIPTFTAADCEITTASDPSTLLPITAAGALRACGYAPQRKVCTS